MKGTKGTIIALVIIGLLAIAIVTGDNHYTLARFY